MWMLLPLPMKIGKVGHKRTSDGCVVVRRTAQPPADRHPTPVQAAK
jgi:hypothetical protein